MAQENNDNTQYVNRPDTRRYEAQDDSGHVKGSRQEESSHENMRKEREDEANDDSALNKLDARGTVGGNETV